MWAVAAVILAIVAFYNAYPHTGWSCIWGIIGKYCLIVMLPGFAINITKEWLKSKVGKSGEEGKK
jgi:hypothetical protein